MSIVVLKPKESHISYEKAAFAFAELYFKVTQKEISVTETDDGVSDLVVIGSDSVNDFLTNEVLNLRLGSLGIRYGTDDYCIRSYTQNGRRVLKRNISNKYCSQPAYELAAHPFKEEAKAYFDLLSSGKEVDFSKLRGSIYLKFEQTPLANMQPDSTPEPCDIISNIAKFLCEIIKTPCL